MSSEVNGTLPIITAGSGGPRPGAAGATAPGVGPKRRGATLYRHKQYMLQCINMDRAYFVSGLAGFATACRKSIFKREYNFSLVFQS
jgi:hypothetical protein